MEFPVLFLGAMPQDTPALYSLMNYTGLKLGTWYPQGGFGKVIDAMKSVAEKNGATFHYSSTVEKIEIEQNKASEVVVNGNKIQLDAVVATADYHHVDRNLLPAEFSNYSEQYWKKKTFAPSCLIFYLGVNKRIRSLNHHTLFFDEDLNLHSKEIYKNPQWPTNPLFYVCCPSKTDKSVAPEEHENLFILMPVAPGIEDNDEIREKYFSLIINRLEKKSGEDLLSYISFKRSYSIKDFIFDYNSYKGNAYGLANTLMQTAILKPKMRNKKIKNLFYAGQLTVPGPGVPPSIISGKIASEQLIRSLKQIP
jgi:phytoene desaturase